VRIELLGTDLQHARQARPDLSEERLVGDAFERGRALMAQPVEGRVPHDLPAEQRVRRLRTLFATTAALVAEMRTRLVVERERFERAATSEREAFMEYVELDRDIVPPLKLEARRLRETVRQLEAEAIALGIDPMSIHPQIDWPSTLAVDSYEAPKYVTNETRRHAAVEFFRRRGD
jgi:hypothetical protein